MPAGASAPPSAARADPSSQTCRSRFYHRTVEDRLIEELFESAGPTIRYRLARELVKDRARTASCERPLLESRLAQLWLGRLPKSLPKLPLDLNRIHGGGGTTIETVVGKLVFLGVPCGHPRL